MLASGVLSTVTSSPKIFCLKVADRGYTAHIADFGIAKLSDEIDSQETVGNTGSPAYMAPEQFCGEYSHNCDLYIMGIILYELMVGDCRFSGNAQRFATRSSESSRFYSPKSTLNLKVGNGKILAKNCLNVGFKPQPRCWMP